jgi:anaerobic selenocysteine-containing dehydrogenase
LRQKVVKPPGEARSDTEIIFSLASRLGYGAQFWDGDIQAADRYQLGPSGLSLEMLREQPGGIQAPHVTRYRKFAELTDGVPRGFKTPTRKIELYSEKMLEYGYPPLPEYEEPLMSPLSRPELAERFPLILTSAKNTLFCETQHRGLASLRRQAMDPEVELHSLDTVSRGIHPGDWVRVETPENSIHARARLNDTLKPGVVCGQHGWWQACPEVGAPGYDPFDAEGSNVNLLIGSKAIDSISGSIPHRAYICQIRRVD